MFQRPPAPCLHPSTALTAPSTCQGSQVPGTAMGPTQSPHTVAKGSISCLLLGWSWGCSQPSTGSMPLTTWAFFGEGLVPCFSAFSVVAKTLPVPRNGPSSNWGCQGATAALQGWLFRRFVPWHTAPPRAFLGLTRRLEPGQAGRGGEQDTLHAPNDTRAAAGPWHRHIPPVQPRGNRTHQTRRVWS